MHKLIGLLIVALLSLSGPAVAGPFEDGATAYERGDYATALRLWRPLVGHDPRAAMNLGVMYAEGYGVEKDTEEAMRLLGPSAIFGDAFAQTRLGMVLADAGEGRNPHLGAAAEWYKRASEQGYAIAQVLLAFAYHDGAGVPQDYVAAHKWANLAAANLPSGQQRNTAVSIRDRVATKMTPVQIAEAQKLAREWTPKPEK